MRGLINIINWAVPNRRLGGGLDVPNQFQFYLQLNDDLLFRRHPRNVSLLIVVFPQK